MLAKKVDLYEYFGAERQEGCAGYLKCYLLENSEPKKEKLCPAMLIVAGGGYSHISPREMDPVARKYGESGFNCFALEYSVAPMHYPTQVIEVIMAMAYIRKNAESLHIDKERVVALGFSAGAHLCGMLATVRDEEIEKTGLEVRREHIQPNAVVLGYPVVSAFHNPHEGSICNISGGDKKLYEKISIETRVTKNTAPAFIWGCLDDPVVHSDNGFLLAQAYKKAGVSFEYHLFESCNGIHGLSICEKETLYENKRVKAWVKLSKRWLENRGFVIK